MADFDLKLLAKYPFLDESKKYVSSLGMSIAEMQEHPVYGSSFEMGQNRVHEALEGRLSPQAGDETSQELSILSFVVARILVNLTRNKSIMRQYARAEARQAHRFLTREDETVLEEIKKDLGLETQENKIHYTRYVQLAQDLAKIKPEWKLVNRRMHKGFIELNKTEELTIIRESIMNKIMSPINVSKTPPELRETANNINNKYSGRPLEISMKELDMEALPPCIKQIIASLEAGSISHNGMFVLATCLLDLGLKTENVLTIFSRYPGYNEEKSRYQIEFLSGKKSPTKYSCPTCARIKGYGLCVQECNIKHPLMYYRDKRKKRR
ncbi:MAG: hypothetical protein B6U72_07470 [Candidatus Altiarchaeales archaeon ex4484_2]|nr:MAG: hypothetical protein B6U72_07470 [Candidatus Altiarchaeales archaeon ex4484_2]